MQPWKIWGMFSFHNFVPFWFTRRTFDIIRCIDGNIILEDFVRVCNSYHREGTPIADSRFRRLFEGAYNHAKDTTLIPRRCVCYFWISLTTRHFLEVLMKSTSEIILPYKRDFTTRVLEKFGLVCIDEYNRILKSRYLISLTASRWIPSPRLRSTLERILPLFRLPPVRVVRLHYIDFYWCFRKPEDNEEARTSVQIGGRGSVR